MSCGIEETSFVAVVARVTASIIGVEMGAASSMIVLTGRFSSVVVVVGTASMVDVASVINESVSMTVVEGTTKLGCSCSGCSWY